MGPASNATASSSFSSSSSNPCRVATNEIDRRYATNLEDEDENEDEDECSQPQLQHSNTPTLRPQHPIFIRANRFDKLRP